jgi:serine/threonine protein kinase
MAIAHAPGMGVFSECQYLRRAGRSAQSETWLVQKPEGSQHAVKLVICDSEPSSHSRLTAHRHPFLMSWDRCEVVNGDLLLLRYWSEETLADYLHSPGQARQEQLSRSILLRHLEETAEVLDFLHRKVQLVHGAVKPSNIGLLHNHVKLLDWGLLTNESLRRRAWSFEDLQVAAPELVRGELVPQSDQYALASIFAMTMAGQPRSFSSWEEYFHFTQQSNQPELALLPAEDRQVIARALAHDPKARYNSCQEFVHALVQNPMAARQEPHVPAERIVIPERDTQVPIVVSESNEPKQTSELLASNAPSDPEIPATVIKSFVKTEGKTDQRHPDSAFLNLNSLVYHSEVTAKGVLTPSLVIGLGGQGIAVLQQLASQLQAKFGNVGNLPNIRLLAVDTDASSLPKPPEANSEASSPASALSPLVAKSGIGAFHCRLATPGGYLWKDLAFAKYADSIPAEHIDLLGSQPKTNQRRSLGRLALLANYSLLREKVIADCKAILQSRALMEATKNTGLPILQDVTPKVYLMAALGGGTGSGALVDVAYLVRDILADLNWAQIQTTVVAFLPADSEDDRAKANAFASLVEMNHHTEHETQRQEKRSRGEEENRTIPGAPFDEVFFWRLSTAEGNKNIYHKAAHWLARDLTTVLGSLRCQSRELIACTGKGKRLPWRGHGFASLRAIRGVLGRHGKNAVCRAFIERWLTPPQEIIDEMQKDGERFLADNSFSMETVLARLEHVAAVVLGREPAELIDEWISPLRKGAAARPPLEIVAQDLLQKVELHFGHGDGCQPAPAILGMQHEAETAAQEICARVPMLLKRYLERPGYRVGASLALGRMLLQWVTENLTELQENHYTVEQEVIQAERTLTQMVNPEERSFVVMGRQRQVTQGAQDLMDYPARVIREDLFARAIFVFQKVKETLLSWLAQLEPCERSLQDLRVAYSDKGEDHAEPMGQLILDGHSNLEDRLKQFQEELPEDAYIKLDLDFSQCLARNQINFADVCFGKTASFSELLELLAPSVEDLLEGILPSQDAAEQLLQSPSLAVVEQLRDAYREARPLFTQQSASRQCAFCLMVSPSTESAQQLLHMAQSTLPQIVAAPEGAIDEVFLYRETGQLSASALYPQGWEAYVRLSPSLETSPHSRTDISWQPLSATKESRHSETESAELAVHV